jgi:hypothetical protein
MEDALREGAGPGYIALSLQHEPLDQIDLRNGGDVLGDSGKPTYKVG